MINFFNLLFDPGCGTWEIISLILAFVWQFYTLWLLVQLHESSETGMHYNRYLPTLHCCLWTTVNQFQMLQATMPPTEKHPSHLPMWKRVMVANALTAMSLFPIATGRYWVYGREVN
ncbi:hypothetical protein WN944_020851 [Citrus x changshan-huyou]|uniref:Uncharacterized protein n=1 Tax=Citrus x changshan-huyou TaxID=2935761 RepID=A0AAP0QUU3_9ROSI